MLDVLLPQQQPYLLLIILKSSGSLNLNRIGYVFVLQSPQIFQKILVIVVFFFPQKTQKVYERADRKHEIYLMRPKGKTQILRAYGFFMLSTMQLEADIKIS